MSDGNASNNRWGDVYLVPVSPCFNCRHATYGQPRCTAFPDFIPWPILKGEHDHRTPYTGDNGIRYERSPYRTTDGPVLASHLYSYAGRRVVTLWIGEDGTCGCRVRDDGDTRWGERFNTALQMGTSPAAFIAYWQESMPNASHLARYESLDALAAVLREIDGADTDETSV